MLSLKSNFTKGDFVKLVIESDIKTIKLENSEEVEAYTRTVY